MRSDCTINTVVSTITFLVGLFWVIPLISDAADAAKLPPPADRSGVTYTADIQPLFENTCTKCHGEEKQKAKLRLDSLEAVLKGAGDEKVIIPGDSANSKLVLAIAHATKDEDEWMPPPEKGEQLTAEQVSLVRAWIDQGAK